MGKEDKELQLESNLTLVEVLKGGKEACKEINLGKEDNGPHVERNSIGILERRKRNKA